MTTKQHRNRILREFSKEFSKKYDRGVLEHGGHLWEKDKLLDSAIEELLDLVAYLYTLREQRRKR